MSEVSYNVEQTVANSDSFISLLSNSKTILNEYKNIIKNKVRLQLLRQRY